MAAVSYRGHSFIGGPLLEPKRLPDIHQGWTGRRPVEPIRTCGVPFPPSKESCPWAGRKLGLGEIGGPCDREENIVNASRAVPSIDTLPELVLTHEEAATTPEDRK